MKFLTENAEILQRETENLLNDERIEPLLREAMVYILSGGKKVRASLLFETVKGIKPELFDDNLIKIGLAIEMIHTYSLVHDDLPALDNDDYRRGKPTLHKKYNEALAILTGDALLTHAFTYASETSYADDIKCRILKELSLSAGPAGMIYGQVMDMEYKVDNISVLKKLHSLKTGKMLILPVKLACIITRCSEEVERDLLNYAQKTGIAFQARDDLLDVTGNTEKMGKTLHKDKLQDKVTYVDLLGIEGTVREIEKLTKDALNSIKKHNLKSLEELALFIGKRDF